ncbi:MAG TPA: Holliday junction resolvase RuvX [Dokdonella sp.]|uniref:Holliday junction resolvase RuvX n=1 Tax=Dokdonella sp. TaxID=2291710 RepID=UPI002C5C038E|nr:Holliday junction resolvase RuvX [Dokdonella sp.]HUD42471.1 Holliday junction resolvase RuvX [Dokdonella sp.]
MSATPDPILTVLGFDYGSRLIGVAVGNRLAGSARALTTIGNGAAPEWTRLDDLVREWKPDAFVVGLPLTLDGGEQAATRGARAFAAALGRRYGRVVYATDERYTSREASRRFADRRAQGAARRKDAASIDALAAEVILEAWMAAPDDSVAVIPS